VYQSFLGRNAIENVQLVLVTRIGEGAAMNAKQEACANMSCSKP
jgi:hypothetical protein